MIKKCCLIGNQNSGKTLLFNLLTGLNQKVGNWPGVTIEKKEGIIKKTNISIIDLPGIYSLSSYTKEEEVSKEYLLANDYDLIINIIDSTSIERALYLTTLLKELDKPMIVVLNMEDILLKQGIIINKEKLEEILKVDVLSISALKKRGIDALIEKIKTFNKTKIEDRIFNPEIENTLDRLKPGFDSNKRFNSIKLLEKDESYSKHFDLLSTVDYNNITKGYDTDILEVLAIKRYEYISNILKQILVKKESKNITQKIDKIVLNKYLAIPIFLVIMLLVYLLAVGIVGGTTTTLIDLLFNGGDTISISIPFTEGFDIPLKNEFLGLGGVLRNLIDSSGGSPWASSLVSDGVIAGIGAVLNFVPQIAILFLLLAILESSGYMARVTYLFDRAFKKIGLSGKSLIPFIVGTGCSVPAIMSSRMIEGEKEKKMTITLTPFMPCSAKLPIINCFITGIFAPIIGASNVWLMTFFMYIFAVCVIIISGLILSKFFKQKQSSSYITELPNYHAPSFRYVFKDVLDKTLAFIKRAGTIIFLCSVVTWLLLNLDYQFRYTTDIEQSMLANIGRVIAFIFAPMLGMNFSWGASVSILQGLVAKEAVVSSMEVISRVSDVSSIFGPDSVFSFFNFFSAMGFVVFTLFSAPCFGAISAMKKELGSTKAMFKAIAFQTLVAYVLASSIGIFGVFLR